MCLVCKKWNECISDCSFLWMLLTKEIDPKMKQLESSWKKTFQKAYTSYLGFWNFVSEKHEFIHPSNMNYVSTNHGGTITENGLYVHNGEYYEIQQTKIFEAHLGMTIEVWFFPQKFQFNEWDNSIVSMHGNAYGWELRGNDQFATFLVTTSTGGHEEIHIPNAIHVNEWNHMAGIIHKSGKTTLFINNESVSLNLRGTKFIHRHNIMLFGKNVDWSNRFFDGYIATVRIVNRELNPQEFLVHPLKVNKEEDETKLKSFLSLIKKRIVPKKK